MQWLLPGIMGPDGGSPEKPVGTVWIAAGSRENITAKQFHFRFDRKEISAKRRIQRWTFSENSFLLTVDRLIMVKSLPLGLKLLVFLTICVSERNPQETGGTVSGITPITIIKS
jgi:hypothetical protein